VKENVMKIVIPGGSGHLGTSLTRHLRERGHDVVVLTRDRNQPGVLWDGRTLGPWATLIDGADAVINLAGRSVNCRYTTEHRQEILRSRVDSTRVIGEAIAQAAQPPRVWLQASTATIYAHRYDAPNDDRTGVIGGNEPDAPPDWRFSIDVARAWEQAVDDAHTPHTRKVKLRAAVVMTTAPGGIFALLRRHIRLGFGRFGDGRQKMSWIHERDFLRAIDFLLEREDLDGAVNVAAPNPVTNEEFTRELREAMGRRLAIPSSGWILRFGAWAMRTEPELVLKSRYVVPRRLLEAGFTFEFPHWRGAVRDLCATWSGRRPRLSMQATGSGGGGVGVW
jgi:uncharacterized protein (TIGR01777 family)